MNKCSILEPYKESLSPYPYQKRTVSLPRFKSLTWQVWWQTLRQANLWERGRKLQGCHVVNEAEVWWIYGWTWWWRGRSPPLNILQSWWSFKWRNEWKIQTPSVVPFVCWFFHTLFGHLRGHLYSLMPNSCSECVQELRFHWFFWRLAMDSNALWIAAGMIGVTTAPVVIAAEEARWSLRWRCIVSTFGPQKTPQHNVGLFHPFDYEGGISEKNMSPWLIHDLQNVDCARQKRAPSKLKSGALGWCSVQGPTEWNCDLASIHSGRCLSSFSGRCFACLCQRSLDDI